MGTIAECTTGAHVVYALLMRERSTLVLKNKRKASFPGWALGHKRQSGSTDCVTARPRRTGVEIEAAEVSSGRVVAVEGVPGLGNLFPIGRQPRLAAYEVVTDCRSKAARREFSLRQEHP